MFGPRTQRFFRTLAEWWVRPMVRLGITPNMLTVMGLVLSALSATAIAMNHLVWGAILLFVGGAFDLSDGALARVQQSRSTFGAFFDSTLDRYSESIVLLGLAYRYGSRAQTPELMVVLAVLVGSLMVSYTRARAEGLGLSCQIGLYARPERVMTLVVGLIFYPWLLWFLVLLAVISNVTAVQRIVYIWQTTHPKAEAQTKPGSQVLAQRKPDEMRAKGVS